jgi:glycosyltransferase involved in cell wall biosynthesis
MADVVEDGINGILVAPADAKAVAAAIERLSQSVELQARLGQAGQKTMTSYTWKRVGQRLDRVLRLAVEGR